MNPLSRLLGLGLFVVLAALVAVLGLPVPRNVVPPGSASPALSAATPSAPSRTAHLTTFHRRVAFPLAITSLVLAAALLASLALRSARAAPASAAVSAARAEIDSITHLARTSLAQTEALARERDVRRRAEENAELNQQRLHQSLEEKARLGRDLHDGIIQSLYAVGLTIESARAAARSDPAEADRRLEQCRESLNRAIRDVRGYIGGLAPDALRQGNFAQSLRAHFEELRAERPVALELHIDESVAAALTLEQETELLQIAHEAFSNSLRHGRAQRLTVRLHQGDHEIALLVQDDGAGFDAEHDSGLGHGRNNMQARAGRLGATLNLHSRPGAGTRLVLTLPLRATL